jgi:hypothetical protein
MIAKNVSLVIADKIANISMSPDQFYKVSRNEIRHESKRLRLRLVGIPIQVFL